MAFTRAIVIGTSTIAIHCAKTLSACGLRAEVVEYQKADISPLERLCENENIPFLRMNKNELTDYIYSILEKCLIVSAFNIYLFPVKIIKKSNIVIINYHNALLPKYAGRNAEAWAIFMQEKESGITWHYVNEFVDNGDVIYQEAILLSDDISSIELLKQQHAVAINSFNEILPGILSGSKGKKQSNPESHNMYYSKDIPNNGILDTTWSAKKIYAFLRAMDYGPLYILGRPVVQCKGNRYIWKKYEYIHTGENRKENQVIIKEDRIEIKCDGADVFLYNLQIAGE